ncbi:MAG: hypothetical protein AVDCRST_MAG87-3424, partial [uncultured Thermomicrobiales bacterium]
GSLRSAKQPVAPCHHIFRAGLRRWRRGGTHRRTAPGRM